MEERNTLEKIKLGNDIAEIDNLLNNPYGFDKQKAIEAVKSAVEAAKAEAAAEAEAAEEETDTE